MMGKVLYGILGAILLPALIAGPVMARAGVLSDGAITLGGRLGEGGYSQGYLDVLAPVFRPGSGLVFVNPRGTIGDGEREEVNLGLGYRHLFSDKKVILGAYFDANADGNAAASIFGQNNTITDNTGNGLEVDAHSGIAAYQLDFGGGDRDSQGQNLLFNNGGFDFVNTGGGTAFVRHNWWGADADPVAGGRTSGTVDADPWLESAPE